MWLGVQLFGPIALTGVAIVAIVCGASPLIQIVLLASGIGWSSWVAWRLVHAAQSVGRMVEAMAAGQYRAILPGSGIREVADIMRALNRVGEQVEAQLSELALQAWRDPLTNLPNRPYRTLSSRQSRAVDQSARQ